MNIVHKLALDLQMPVGGKIYVKQGDKMTRSIVLSLYDGGAPFNPPNVGILQLVFLKPDRTGGVYDTMPDGTKACVLLGNTVTASLHPQMFTASGTVVCELRMLNADGSSILSTFGWSIFVEASAEAGIKSESYYHFASISSLTAAIGNLNDLVTNDKESIVGAINELHSVTVSITKTEVIARSGDGCNYSTAVEGLEISVGTEIILIPQSTNQGAATLALNGGEAYPLCLRPGWNVTGNDLRPQLAIPLEAGSLLRGGEYVFRFDGSAWILQSHLAAPQSQAITEYVRQFTARVPRIDRVMGRDGLGKDYLYDYTRTIAEEANGHTKAKALTFLWVTDTHSYEDSTWIGSVAAQMTNYVPCSFIAHTGDIIDGLVSPAEGLSTLSELNRNLTEAACPVLYAKGNHDDNCLYARKQVDAGPGLGEDYILTSQLYARTNAFRKEVKSPAGNGDMYFYFDDEVSKIRSIFLNSYDYSEERDENGIRLEDCKTGKVFRQEQLDWLAQEALDFSGKEGWAVMLFSHEYLHADVYKILGDFQNGINRFAGQGSGEVIAWFVGDDHLDMLSWYHWSYDNFSTARLTCLNASSALDNWDAATEDNAVLYPPKKKADTEDETAFDLVTVDRENHRIYLTRFGARSYVYNPETGSFDTVAARTRVVDYKTGTYKVLTEGDVDIIEPEEELVEATNVLKGVTFEAGGLNSSGENDDSIITNIRSSMVDISSLQATTSTVISYHFVIYSTGDQPVSNATDFRYDAAGAKVNANSFGTGLVAQYGYPAGAIAIDFNYNMYTPIKKWRVSINYGGSPKIRLAIYKIVDGAAQLVDECDVKTGV